MGKRQEGAESEDWGRAQSPFRARAEGQIQDRPARAGETEPDADVRRAGRGAEWEGGKVWNRARAARGEGAEGWRRTKGGQGEEKRERKEGGTKTKSQIPHQHHTSHVAHITKTTSHTYTHPAPHSKSHILHPTLIPCVALVARIARIAHGKSHTPHHVPCHLTPCRIESRRGASRNVPDPSGEGTATTMCYMSCNKEISQC